MRKNYKKWEQGEIGGQGGKEGEYCVTAGPIKMALWGLVIGLLTTGRDQEEVGSIV